MTLAEYELRMESFQLKQTFKIQELALQAWFNQTVQGLEDDGKTPKYKTFEQFFDIQKEIDKVRVQFEPDYQPVSAKREEIEQDFEKQRIRATRKKQQKDKYNQIVERMKEYQRLHPRKKDN